MAKTDGVGAVHRVAEAINAHDPERLASCFTEDYVNEAPNHPNRSFVGRAQVQRNWTAILGAVPDLRATVVASNADGDRVWCEWDWQGTRADGAPHRMRGVTITDVSDGLISRARFYMEPVVEDGVAIDDAVRSAVGAAPGRMAR